MPKMSIWKPQLAGRWDPTIGTCSKRSRTTSTPGPMATVAYAALAATRLVGYLRTAAVDINVIAGVFGASGTGFWITIDFKDDLDLICFPLTLSSRDGGVEPKPRVSPQRSS